MFTEGGRFTAVRQDSSTLPRLTTASWTLIALACVAPAAATAQDTLVYNVLLRPRDGVLSVEARLVRTSATPLLLADPPLAGPAYTAVGGLAATDDRGTPVTVRRTASGWTVLPHAPGPVRFRYQLELRRRTADGSTGAGLDTLRLYAVTRSLFVAPDVVAARKTGSPYPLILVDVIAPGGWRVVSGWEQRDGTFRPADGDDLLGSTLAAAPDFRTASGRAGSAAWRLAIRGTRYFTDSALIGAIGASLTRATAALGPLTVPTVTYTAEVGRKGRMSGSLQGRSSIGLVWEPSEILETTRLHDLFHETLHLWFGGTMTTDRWWVEGVSDYFAARLLADWRADPAILAALCWRSLANYRRIEHRARVSMLDETRQGIGGDNTELLVYRKGMLAGLLLDASIRRASGGRLTLDSAARSLLALAAATPQRTVRQADLRATLVRAGGEEVEQLWSRVVAGTAPLEEAEIAAALSTVTGQPAPPAVPRPKTGKRLRD